MEKQTRQKKTKQKQAAYVASEELIRAVRCARTLHRPLLVKGEPGTGKTTLAAAVAEELGEQLLVWNIKSTSKAQDGLYVYDVVQRLYDSQFGGKSVENIAQYIHLGQLGQAFQSAQPKVVLIDEIDKADPEFPNDLLWELDQMEFHIPETGETIRAKQVPTVIITSNAEKDLPDAFLRRCLFYYIPFPTPEQMRQILLAHFPELDRELMDQAVEAFYQVREISQLQKRPATSELIDWVRLLQAEGVDVSTLTRQVPLAGVLLKKEQDLALLKKRNEA